MIDSSNGMNTRLGQKEHLILGLEHRVLTHSFLQVGEYPLMPFAVFSHNFGKTSARQRNNLLNKLIRSSDEVGGKLLAGVPYSVLAEESA